MFSYKMTKQFIKFCIIGGISTVINYAVFYYLYQTMKVGYLFSSTTGFIAGMIFGYYFNRTWTYKSAKSYKKLVMYFMAYGVSLVIGLILLRFFVENMHFDARVANLLVIIVTTLTNFIFTKFFVFRR